MSYAGARAAELRAAAESLGVPAAVLFGEPTATPPGRVLVVSADPLAGAFRPSHAGPALATLGQRLHDETAVRYRELGAKRVRAHHRPAPDTAADARRKANAVARRRDANRAAKAARKRNRGR